MIYFEESLQLKFYVNDWFQLLAVVTIDTLFNLDVITVARVEHLLC